MKVLTDTFHKSNDEAFTYGGTRKGKYTNIHELIDYKLSQMSKNERGFFNYSLFGLSGFGVVSAIVINSLFRKSLMVYEGAILTSTVVPVLSSAFNLSAQSALVQTPIVKGTACSVCATVRGGAVQTITTCLVPAGISVGMAAVLAERYKSAEVPSFGFPPDKHFRSFWAKIFKQVFRKASPLIFLQALLGGVVAYRQHQIIEKAKMTITKEELQDLWQEASRNISVLQSS
uniref:Transmembrane protein 126A-like n=1 Tax=Ciona intestinalis TaxID=7719 RepID=F6RZL7_CIOIN|nr:transmembrane protein 126A-like [Ciona intestinalis]|eukprot:XP_002124594.1 transmembrane protein 126A-like [Ciona intestinalis]